MTKKYAFSCVTSARNPGAEILHTINSVVAAAKNLLSNTDVFYLIHLSSDEKNILEAINIAIEDAPKNCLIRILQVSDNSLYEGLSLSFLDLPSAEWFHYLNSGDIIDQMAYSVISRMSPCVEWVTGRPSFRDEFGGLVDIHKHYPIYKSFFKSGLNARYLNFIQQESTFVRQHLLFDIFTDPDFKNYKYAGDYFIWLHLLQKNIRLRQVDCILGSFTIHEGQLSNVHRREYLAEVETFCNKPNYFTILIAIFMKLRRAIVRRICR